MLVLDATPLIYLAKAELLQHLTDLEEDIVVPKEVYREVVGTGKEEGHADAYMVEDFLENARCSIVDSTENDIYRELEDNPDLSRADIDVLAVAKEREATAVMDEDYARTMAEVEDVKHHGSVYLILLMVKEEIIGAERGQKSVDTMVENGWYCSTDLYAKIKTKLDELADGRNN